MNLASLISSHTGTPLERIMLLRHSNSQTTSLLRHNATLDDYTYVQPKNTSYDYLHDDMSPIDTVGVIVYDRLYRVIRVDGIQSEGTTRSLVSSAFCRFDIDQDYPEIPARRYSCTPLAFPYLEHAVEGWTNKRRPVARYGSRMFDTVMLVH